MSVAPSHLAQRCLWWLAFGIAGLPVAAQSASTGTAPLNDSGQWRCVKRNFNFSRHCAGTGQDGEFGRDATHGGNANGHAGFSFEKIGPLGEVLPPDAQQWRCVRDRVTGLMWENKTHDGGVHDGRALYTNLDNGRPGDVSALVAATNEEALCGAADWRLPNRREVESLVDFSIAQGTPMIDTTWFSDSASNFHWTSSRADQLGGGPHYRWAVSLYDGRSIWYGGMYGDFAARLVRQGHKVNDQRWAVQGAEVLDQSTGLVWRRCAEGQTWSGSTCTGAPTVFLTAADATDHAKAQAQATGQPWRAPNIKELASLVDERFEGPALNPAIFPGFACGMCHSNTRWTMNPVDSWRLEFYEGSVTRDFWGGNMVLVRDTD